MKNKCIYCCEYTAEICPACAGKGHEDTRADELKKVGNVIDEWWPTKRFPKLAPIGLKDIEELKKSLGI